MNLIQPKPRKPSKSDPPRQPNPLSMPSDKFQEECAVFGVYGHREAANLTYLGLYALQHRGQEGSGIVSSDGTASPSTKRDGVGC